MSYVRQIHQQAIAEVKQANEAYTQGELYAYRANMKNAFELEKKAALLLVNEFQSEPTRSVLFRSAASIALRISEYGEAVDLIRLALTGSPFDEIKDELLDLLNIVKNDTEALYPAVSQTLYADNIYGYAYPQVIISTGNRSTIPLPDTNNLLGEEKYPDSRFLTGLSNLVKEQELFKNSFTAEMCCLFLNGASANAAINRYAAEKLTLLEKKIVKPDTRSVWFSVGYFFSVYRAITTLNASGIRIYFGEYEDNHSEFPGQACLILVPTRYVSNKSGTEQLQEDIIIKNDKSDSAFRNHIGGNNAFIADYVSSDIINQRVLNYKNNHYPVVCKAIGKADTTSIWYSMEFIQNMLKALVYFSVTGVRLYFGTEAEDSLSGRTNLFFVPTKHQNNTNADITMETTKAFSDIAKEYYSKQSINRNAYFPTVLEQGYNLPNTGKIFPFI